MSDALISSQNQRINDLQGENSNLKAALKEARKEKGRVAEERDALRKQAETLTTERDTAMAAAKAAPDDLRRQIAGLQGQLASRDHKDVFRAAAREAGVSEKNVADLYNLSGLKPGDGAADPQVIADFLAAQKEARPWAFDNEGPPPLGQGAPGGDAGSQSIRLAPATAPVGGGRGAPDHSSAKFRVTADQLGDGTWMHTNHEAVARASADGRLEIV